MIQSINNLLPSIPNVINGISNNISKLAIPVVAIAGCSFISVSEAGPIAAGICYTTCMAAGAALGPGAAIYIPICLQGCAIALAAPTP